MLIKTIKVKFLDCQVILKIWARTWFGKYRREVRKIWRSSVWEKNNVKGNFRAGAEITV